MAVATDMNRGPWRLEVRCNVTFHGPLHVGTGERLDTGTDSPVLRDADDNLWLPGSGVRGVIRDWCEREAPLLGIGRQFVFRLFGRTPRKGQKTERATNDRQGRLTVLDARLTGRDSDIRDHVRIRREYGAADKGGKFDQEVGHPSAATLTFVYDGDGVNDPEVQLLWSAVKALEEGVIGFGAKRGWGFGAVRVESTTWRAFQRTDREQLSEYLRDRLGEGHPTPDVRGDIETAARNASSALSPRKRASGNKGKEDPEPRAWAWLRLGLRLQCEGPMLVADFYHGTDLHCSEALADATYRVGPDGRPYLPGSSARGTLASHAERIARSLDCSPATRASAIARVLFGWAKGDRDRAPEDEQHGGQRRGDGQSDGHKGLVSIGEGRLVGQPHTVVLNHVAIDRVTGFAAEGKLFSAVALASPTFETTVLVRWDPDEEHERAAVALLLFALRDAVAGLLWVGSRTTRGYGHVSNVQVTSARLSHLEKNAQAFRRLEPRDLTLTTFADLETFLASEFKAWRKLALPAQTAGV